jgi:chaperonin GroEL (HSP60 family)
VLSDVCHCGICSVIKVIHHTGTVIREEIGLSLDKADTEVLGTAAKVVITKDSTTIVGDGSTQEEVTKRVTQIKNQIEVFIFELNILRFDILFVE